MFVDEHMNSLDPATTLVYIVICRQTIGWQKETDAISLSQFVRMTGLSKPTITKAIKQLVSSELIAVQSSSAGKIRDTNQYSLRSKTVLPPSKLDLPPSKLDLPDGSKSTLPPVVNEVYTQKKVLNKREINSASRKRDERIDSWQLTVYRELCRLHVPHALRDSVLNTVTDESVWRTVILAWLGRGYRPNAISGMLDWYQKGIPNARQQRPQRQNDGRDTGASLSPDEYVRSADAI
jgi:phage replication O-like protein O